MPNPVTIGTLTQDTATLNCLGFSLAISGDDNYNAAVAVAYRKAGDASWKTGLPLMRVRPEYLSTEDVSPFPIGQQFAGSIFDLDPGTTYDVQLTVTDPDGGGTVINTQGTTRAVPPANPITPNA